jgi:hypothetical protein
MSEATHPHLRTGLVRRLRAKLPEILIEACSVALAVVLALWANDWSDNRRLDAQASELKAAVASELRSNLADLADSRPGLQRAIDDAHHYLEPDGRQVHSLQFNVRLSLLSAAAWQTVQSSNAVQRLEPDWRIRVAKVYELQALYQRQQESTLGALNAIAIDDKDERPSSASVRALDTQMRTMMGLNQQLDAQYRALLRKSGSGS